MIASSHWSSFEANGDQIQDQTASECSREFDLLKRAFDLYSEGFSAIPKSGNGKAMVARLALLSQNLNSFHVMINSASRGFYIQSLIPLRNVFENWLAFWYLEKFPDEADRWLDPTWQMRPPKAETMRNKIDHPSQQTKSKLKDFYDELNRFAHTDPAAILSILEQEGEKTYIGVGIRFDVDNCRACAYGLFLWIGNCLDALSIVIPDSHEWQGQCHSIADEILQFIDEYNANKTGVAAGSPK